MCATKVAPPMFHVKHSLSLAEGGRGWIVMLSEAKHLVIASECNERGNQRAKNPNTFDDLGQILATNLAYLLPASKNTSNGIVSGSCSGAIPFVVVKTSA